GGAYGYPAPIGFEEGESGYSFELHAEEPELLPFPQEQSGSELPTPMPENNEARSSSRRTHGPAPPPIDPRSPILPASYDATPAAMKRLPSVD
ncbi:MAG TPA: hypothetical protein P5307_08350, partial [Pirellulaceae bacterium]|nr:hypothetical protein [Pirellulaceae bacterium]